ncbi:MAG: DNA-binding protein [Candidatus Abyssobacteria bacterium SURF_17]|uniref:DNA-binding protein n=1 Tax=Candidatus Abyssobacteria bacterium SURF_17 TaxID=2093361 RepID=A0A419F9T8_9BACT|nr:MAG: DNA-binding protein [Candidatus Abyssubacteria bacterium SURF_17]
MKKVLLCVAVILITATFFTNAFAQGMGGGWGRNAEYQRMYDPDTVETLSGVVVKVAYITPMRGMGQGVHLQLKTDDDTISVHLGPKWYLENQDVQIRKGDQITVKGSRITFNEKPALIAAEIEKGDEILTLRDENGFPMWAGWRRR